MCLYQDILHDVFVVLYSGEYGLQQYSEVKCVRFALRRVLDLSTAMFVFVPR